MSTSHAVPGTPDWLAKPAVDVGLFTQHRDPMLRFWQQEAGVPFSEMLPLGGGLQQHRHAIGDSVLKINHSRQPLEQSAPGGIRALTIGRPEVTAPRALEDPDGNRVTLVPAQVTALCVDLTVSDLAAHRRFYGEALGLPEPSPGTFACGASRIRLSAGESARDPEQRAPGYRYLTVQVFDVRGIHQAILDRGGREGRPPVQLGDVACISFVRDPDGNWIEISQRKSITGSLD